MTSSSAESYLKLQIAEVSGFQTVGSWIKWQFRDILAQLMFCGAFEATTTPSFLPGCPPQLPSNLHVKWRFPWGSHKKSAALSRDETYAGSFGAPQNPWSVQKRIAEVTRDDQSQGHWPSEISQQMSGKKGTKNKPTFARQLPPALSFYSGALWICLHKPGVGSQGWNGTETSQFDAARCYQLLPIYWGMAQNYQPYSYL